MPPRSALWPHPDADSAVAKPGSLPGSPWLRSIGGDWRFHWAPHPDKRPWNFQDPGFDDSQWKNIPVPGCIELYGYGTPLYSNSVYPFQVDPPRVMGEPPKDWTAYAERNPVGSYRRWVEIPADWSGQRIFLQVGAAGGCLSVWVNGKTIGYSEDSRLATEFDITDAVHPGKNLIALQVLRNSDGSYLEDQDIWRLTGFSGMSSFLPVRRCTCTDVAVESELDDACRDAKVRLRCQVMNQSREASGPFSVRMTLRDPSGKKVEGFEVVIPVKEGIAAGKELELLSESVDFRAPEKWSFDKPALYTAVVELLEGRSLSKRWPCGSASARCS
jgi:beta-galactosidase